MAKQKKNTLNDTGASNPSGVPFNWERAIRFSGLILIFFSAILFIALISYCFNWKIDQGEVLNPSWKILFSKTLDVQNAMGRLGAYLSHTLIYTFFGIGSFIIPYIIFTFGVNILFAKRLFPTLKISFYTALGLILIPLFAQYFFPNAEFSVGGGMGKMLYEWLSTLLGRLGLGIILIGGAISYLTYRFRNTIRKSWNNYQISQEEKKAAAAQQEKMGGESIIPEEKPTPISHYEDNTYDVLTEQTKKGENIAPIEAQKETPITFETKVITQPSPIHPTEEPAFEIDNKPEVLSEPDAHKPTLDLEVEQPMHKEDESSVSEKIYGSIGSDYDHTLELSRFKFPPLDLLEDHGDGEISIDKADLEDKKNQIVSTLLNYNISIDKIKATVGPTVTLYEIVPSAGVRISKIRNLEDDIALSLAALGIRIIAPIPGKGTIGIEVPNIKKAIVSMRSMIGSEKFRNADMDLPIAIGKTITNEYYIADLAKMPHLLMAGATGQGKSVGLNALLVSLLYKKHPSELKFVLVDPKKVELSLYKKIEDCYLAKLPDTDEAIITDTKQVIFTLNSLCKEMDQRYDLLKAAMVRNIKEYNAKFTERKLNPQNGHRYLPYIVLVIDEFADLMMTAGKEVEMPIARLAQLARAIGIHLVIATQRPSVNIITGVIKANFPGRIAFKVASKIDSRTILDAGGADQLIGRGDLLLSLNSDIIRLQCPFVDTPEVENIADFIEEQHLPCETYLLPEYVDENNKEESLFADDPSSRDPLFDDAARLIVMNQVGSTSLIQRKLSIGYNRAGRLMDQLEAAKIVGANAGSKAREVLVFSLEELEQILQST